MYISSVCLCILQFTAHKTHCDGRSHLFFLPIQSFVHSLKWLKWTTMTATATTTTIREWTDREKKTRKNQTLAHEILRLCISVLKCIQFVKNVTQRVYGRVQSFPFQFSVILFFSLTLFCIFINSYNFFLFFILLTCSLTYHGNRSVVALQGFNTLYKVPNLCVLSNSFSLSSRFFFSVFSTQI